MSTWGMATGVSSRESFWPTRGFRSDSCHSMRSWLRWILSAAFDRAGAAAGGKAAGGNADRGSNRNSHVRAERDAHAASLPFTDTKSDCDADGRAVIDADTHANGHADSWADCDSNTRTDADTYADADTDTDATSDADTNAGANADTNADADTHRIRPHGASYRRSVRRRLCRHQ